MTNKLTEDKIIQDLAFLFGEKRSFIFIAKLKDNTIKVLQKDFIEIGLLEISWRSIQGDLSSIKPYQILYENKKKEIISYLIISKPSKIIIEEITTIKIKVWNNLNEELDLVVYEDIYNANNSVTISSFSHKELGVVKGLNSVEFTISFIAKYSGIQKISGVSIVDKKSKTEWKLNNLEEILVENSHENKI